MQHEDALHRLSHCPLGKLGLATFALGARASQRSENGASRREGTCPRGIQPGVDREAWRWQRAKQRVREIWKEGERPAHSQKTRRVATSQGKERGGWEWRRRGRQAARYLARERGRRGEESRREGRVQDEAGFEVLRKQIEAGDSPLAKGGRKERPGPGGRRQSS